ncbi:sugar ABC transporter permease [Candidatus Aerophobetes bacterium]|nr:sugar ABC transporter permease [Candidatus Aerophobetes bacterium]
MKIGVWIERHILIIFLIPLLLTLCAVLLYPLGYSLISSFYKWSIARPFMGKKFIGISQYVKAFKDELFISSVVNTFIFTGIAVSIELTLGIGIALLLAGDFKGKKIFQSVLFIPVVLTPVGVGILWKILLNTDMGLIPYLFSKIGFTGVSFLSNPILAKFAIIIVDVWETTPFVFIMILAALESLPPEPFEAAVIDGASRWQLLQHITFPLIKPIILVILLIRTMDIFRIFDTIYVMTGGGPGSATESVSTYTIRVMFEFFETGYASTLSFIILAIIIVMSLILTKIFKVEYLQTRR